MLAAGTVQALTITWFRLEHSVGRRIPRLSARMMQEPNIEDPLPLFDSHLSSRSLTDYWTPSKNRELLHQVFNMT